MTDFDALIDKFDETYHYYMHHKAARSALREAIAEQGRKLADALSCNEKLSDENMKLVEANATLEAELKEADADAERLDKSPEWYKVQTNLYRCPFCGNLTKGEPEYLAHTDDCPHVLHVARLSKRGQGKEEGKL